MAIPQAFIQDLLARADVVEIVGRSVQLKKAGANFAGLCPFHAEKSPSFYINAEEGVYFCHGCQVGGDVITFLREVEHLDFAEAVERLAARAGIQLRYDDVKEGQDQKRRGVLVDAMAAFAPPGAGQTTLPSDYQQSLLPVITSAWHGG